MSLCSPASKVRERRQESRANLGSLLNLGTVLFAVSSTLGVGLRYTVREIVGPLRSSMALGVLANFVLVPLLAYGVARLFNLERDHPCWSELCSHRGQRDSCPSWSESPTSRCTR